MGLVQFAQAKIASGRITKYLTLPRLSPYIDYKEDGSLKEGEIVIDNATFAWVSFSLSQVLNNLITYEIYQ